MNNQEPPESKGIRQNHHQQSGVAHASSGQATDDPFAALMNLQASISSVINGQSMGAGEGQHSQNDAAQVTLSQLQQFMQNTANSVNSGMLRSPPIDMQNSAPTNTNTKQVQHSSSLHGSVPMSHLSGQGDLLNRVFYQGYGQQTLPQNQIQQQPVHQLQAASHSYSMTQPHAQNLLQNLGQSQSQSLPSQEGSSTAVLMNQGLSQSSKFRVPGTLRNGEPSGMESTVDPSRVVNFKNNELCSIATAATGGLFALPNKFSGKTPEPTLFPELIKVPCRARGMTLDHNAKVRRAIAL
jgi:hypothetical protein